MHRTWLSLSEAMWAEQEIISILKVSSRVGGQPSAPQPEAYLGLVLRVGRSYKALSLDYLIIEGPLISTNGGGSFLFRVHAQRHIELSYDPSCINIDIGLVFRGS